MDRFPSESTEGKAQGTHLSEQAEVRLMRGQGQHDEISIQAVQAMPCVGIPARPAPLLPDHVHDLVLPPLLAHLSLTE